MKEIPDKIYQKFILRLKEVSDILNKQKKVILAVSGGPDSMFLLFLFYKFSLKHKIEIFPVYINHNLRSKKEIQKDIQTIEKFCNKHNLRLIIDEIKPKKYDENTLRQLRYDRLLNQAYNLKCSIISTAHTQTDLAETFILNLLRGSGLKGLCGIPFLRVVNFKKHNIYIIRPLIDINKKEILEILKENKISYVIDKTNLEDFYKRNLLRNKIFPLFKKINSNFESNIVTASSLINRVYEIISNEISKKIRDCLSFKNSNVFIDLKKFLMYNEFTQREIFYRIISEIAIRYSLKLKQGYKNLVEQLIEFLKFPENKKPLTKNIYAFKTKNFLKINVKT